MRHAFVSYFYALNQNENLTAAVAGNSAQMVHQHYKALATIEEAADWFGVVPPKEDNVVTLDSTSKEHRK